MTTLDRATWAERRRTHQERVDTLTAGHRERAARGQKHAIDDFLFEYYSHRVSHLRRWSPGAGVVLADSDDLGEPRWFRRTPAGLEVDTERVCLERGRTLRAIVALLEASGRRTPSFRCFGMHEWAMVLGQEPDQTRHHYLGLRFPPDQIRQIVAANGLHCTHFDAFRFFTPEAAPANEFQPTRDTQIDLDQPGCLHVTMDLYKAAYKAWPLVPSELMVDCFELARSVRLLDMRASAYDVTSLGHTPVKVETAEGRAEYVRLQKSFEREARPLRASLLGWLRPLALEVAADADADQR